jgi:hypothetical protein
VTSSIEVNGDYREQDFRADGSLRDVCILGVDLNAWERLLRAVVDSPWKCQFEVDGAPRSLEEFVVREFFAAKNGGVDVSARLGILVGSIWFDCFFFDEREIEFSFDPSELVKGKHFGSLKRLMIWLDQVLDRRVVVTMETAWHDGIPPLLETRRTCNRGGSEEACIDQV